MLKSFDTTVQTPLKLPGRDAPQRTCDSWASSTHVEKSAAYIESAEGAKSTSAPAPSQAAVSAAIGRGYREKSSFGPNCAGLTKMLTTTVPGVSPASAKTR